MNRSSSAGTPGSIALGETDSTTTQTGVQPSPILDLPTLPGSSIIGRDEELAYILSTVEERSTQLLTILGPGGVGKTRLVLTAAWELAPSFADGVVFIPFTTPELEQVWQLVVHKLGIFDAPERPNLAALYGALESKDILLILDNCETIPEAFSLLPNLLAACPGVMVLATSQEALKVRGEQEFWLQPLDLPKSDTQVTVDDLKTSSAVRLFAQRAGRRNPAFALNEDNAGDIAAIVCSLDGLPLAIELAAAQMRHLSPTALRQRLETALPSLAGGSRDLPERHRSLIGVMEWSLSLLTGEDRRRFLQLSVLAGDFTPETASRIVGLSPVDGWELLISFADRSLIKRVVADSQQSTRFFMLRTIQKVSLHLLQQSPEAYLEASARHAEACLEFALEAAEHWHTGDQMEWLRRVEEEHANIQWVIERALADPRLAHLALKITEPMFWFWYSRGYHSWVLQRIENILKRAPADIPPDVRGSTHITAGWLAFKQTQVTRAEHHFSQGLRLIRDPASRAALRGAIGLAYVISFDGRNTPQAVEQLQGVVERAKTNPEAWHEQAAGQFGLGLTYYFNGQIPQARAGFEASLQIARARDDRQSLAMNLLYLAHTDRVEGKPRAAIRKLQEAVPVFLEVGGDANVLLGLDVIVSLLADLGELRMAGNIAAASEHTRRTQRIPRSPLEQGDFDEAMHRIRQGLRPDELAPPFEPGDALCLSTAVEEFLQYRPAPAGQPDNESPVAALLSPRELEVLRMVAEGKTATSIAKMLYVSPHTIKRHMANIRVKLGVRTQAAAVAALQRTR